MIKAIIGTKGTGKTKKLIEMVNEAAKTEQGNVVCLEYGDGLKYDISSQVRLINIKDYNIKGFDAFCGFVKGLLAGNYDITDVFVDSILKVGGEDKDIEGFEAMIAELDKCIADRDVNIVFTVSYDVEAMPESLKKYL